MRSAQSKKHKPAERLCLWRATRGTLIFRAALVQTAAVPSLAFRVSWTDGPDTLRNSKIVKL
jgi:hypothetical protein